MGTGDNAFENISGAQHVSREIIITAAATNCRLIHIIWRTKLRTQDKGVDDSEA